MTILLLLLGCDDGVETDDPCVDDPPLTWENFGLNHMRTHCNGCHGSQLRDGLRNDAPMGIDFDTWQGVVQWGERIQIRTIEEKNMPPLGGPTEAELERFAQWMACEVLPEVDQ